MVAQVVQTEYRITQNDPNVEVFAVAAGVRGLAARFIVPRATRFLIRPGDILSALLQDAGSPPDEIDASSLVEIIKTDPNGIVDEQLVTTSYRTIQEFSDRNSLFTIGKRVELFPDERLELYVTPGTEPVDEDLTEFQISTQRFAEIRL